eukprot:10375295-Alexandrium_andersonii.AAC.1
MSASLVGSEMCIRDSGYRDPELFGNLAAGFPAVGDLAAAGEFPRWPKPCLLYTSDAADDM